MAINEDYFVSLALDIAAAPDTSGVSVALRRASRLICFELGIEEYAIPIDYVREIINLIPITPVPHSPEFIMGIINLRGEIYSVVDLGLLLGMTSHGKRASRPHLDNLNPDGSLSTDQAIVVLSIGDKTFGVMVDCITGIIDREGALSTIPPSMLEGVTQQVVSEVLQSGDRLTMVIDLRELIANEKLRRMEEERDPTRRTESMLGSSARSDEE